MYKYYTTARNQGQFAFCPFLSKKVTVSWVFIVAGVLHLGFGYAIFLKLEI
jgi:hypothetical protein